MFFNCLIFQRFSKNSNSIKKAILFPLYNQIEEFANELEMIENKKLSLSNIIRVFMTIAQYKNLYSLEKGEEFCSVKIF